MKFTNVCKLVCSSILISIACTTHAQEYKYRNVEIVAGGFVTGIIYHPTEQGLAYARTDMGGAYRLDGTTRRWTPITDRFHADDWNMYGIESMVIDPTDPDRVYMACGTYAFNNWAGNASFFSSTNRGETWTRIPLSFKLGANEDGRGMGERLALDPNSPNILYLGTRQNGLWRTTNRGANWSQVTSFPTISTPRDVGLSFVLIDESTGTPGNASQRIYVGVARAGSQGANLYRSTNGGSTWTAVPNTPGGDLMPYQGQIAADGTIYFTFSDGPGPNNITQGEVWKLNQTNGQWTRLLTNGTNQGGFGGLAVDPQDPNTLMVGTICRWWPNDQIYRSTNGGSTWRTVGTGTNISRNASASPYLRWGAADDSGLSTGNWVSAFAIDPFNRDRVLYATGATVWGCDNIRASDNNQAIVWEVRAQGIEQTAILSLASPPSGPQLLSGLGDVCGFVHTDVTVSPQNGMIDPAYKDGVSVDFAELNPSKFVIIGHDYTPNYFGSYSTDAGLTWTRFASTPTNREDGMIAISANGNTIIWAPKNGAPSRTTNNGGTWTQSTGIGGSATLVSDRVNSNNFYAIRNGTFYRSTNAGSSFTATVSSGFTGTKLKAVPGHENHVWIPGSGGLYRTTNGGTTITRITSVQSADVVGFGKAAPGQSYPAIFITGTINNTYGVYRSDDEGQNWIRINDDLHQWGWIAQVITGDPRVFGRFYLATNGRGIIMGEPESGDFTCTAPNLGDNFSLCGMSTPIVIESNTTQLANTTYTWYRNNVVIANETSPTLSITTAGTYRVVRDSATCSKSDEILVSSIIPAIDLGANRELCETPTIVLDAGVTGTGLQYEWSKNGTTIPNATQKTYEVSSSGVYRVSVSASGCTSVNDEVEISSSLLSIIADTVCIAGEQVLLEIQNTGGPYAWYNQQTDGIVLHTGSTYSPIISNTTTFYVQDNGGVVSTIGKTAVDGGGWYTNTFSDLSSQMTVTVTEAIKLESVSVDVQTPQSSITIRLTQGGNVAYTYTASNVGGGMQVIPVNFDLVPGTYTIDAVGSTSSLYLQNEGATYPYSIPDYISISNAEGWATTWYSIFYSWQLRAGSQCARTPITAVVDPTNSTCNSDNTPPTVPGNAQFSNISQNSFTASWTASTDNVGVTGYDVYLNGTLYETVGGITITITELNCNTEYAVSVRARDAAGNTSALNAERTTTTLGITAPVITDNSPVCQDATIELSIPVTDGAIYSWSGPSGFTANTPTVSRSNASITMAGLYTATITVNDCISETSTTTVTVNATPEPPLVTSPITYSIGETAVPLSATGTNILWYTTQVEGTGSTIAPTPSTAEIGTTNFYLTQTILGCESSFASISVFVESNTITQSISLEAGWNLISFYTLPDNASIENVFGASLSHIHIIKDNNGFYMPEQNASLQSLQTINLGRAYLVRANTPTTISIIGNPITPTSISLQAGWNLLGYPKDFTSPLTQELSEIWTETQIIKNFDAFREQSSGTLENLTPGEGYYIYMNTSRTIVWN